MASRLPLGFVFAVAALVAWGSVGGAAPGRDLAPPASHEDACGAAAAGAPVPRADDVLARLDTLHAAFAHLPGFLDVYYHEDGTYRPTFAPALPPEVHAVASDVPLSPVVLPAVPSPVGGGALPDAGDTLCTGIRPGGRVTTPIGVCTLGFVFTDGVDTFVATAGHCIRRGQTAVVTGVGPIGAAVFSTGSGGVGNDFALIRVDPGLVHLVSAEMCHFAGPTGVYASPWLFHHAVLQTGHGLGVVGAPPRPKVGWGVSIGARSFSYAGASAPGDSGSPARVDLGLALGTVTHIGVGGGNNFGTRLPWAMQASGIANLTLVTVPYVHPV